MHLEFSYEMDLLARPEEGYELVGQVKASSGAGLREFRDTRAIVTGERVAGLLHRGVNLGEVLKECFTTLEDRPNHYQPQKGVEVRFRDGSSRLLMKGEALVEMPAENQ